MNFTIKDLTSDMSVVKLGYDLRKQWKESPETLVINNAHEYLIFTRRRRSDPLFGWWYPSGNTQCCFCGIDDRDGYYVMDHCHVSGWKRGTLCGSCNQSEARNFGSTPIAMAWDLWRHTAPLLSERDQYGPGILPQSKLLTMTIEQIFEFNEHLQDIIQRKALEEAKSIWG